MILAIPTDTCYWFATSLYDEAWFRLIYEIKWREATKRLSTVVRDFTQLNDIIKISSEQIDFLKKYKFPFTIIWEKSNKFILPSFLDKNDYSKIAVRVWDKCLGNDVIESLEFPMFLTSANQSWEPELYSDIDIRLKFWHFPELKIIEWTIPKSLPSDIFCFVWDTLELDYLRRNH
jgi:tRNA A37 threonylcarbamoyladenosine synthetase subunit TsaC/SUA5/YrdC